MRQKFNHCGLDFVFKPFLRIDAVERERYAGTLKEFRDKVDAATTKLFPSFQPNMASSSSGSEMLPNRSTITGANGQLRRNSQDYLSVFN
ncbi:hypothetical protein [Undibacterium sp.]|uniref:hypothetical protein n=1 Tax=Undibacterium sp. TaxID=1914977 RepID=UPI002D7F9A86|nr:hypothetical protein [Undibacterium sp.]